MPVCQIVRACPFLRDLATGRTVDRPRYLIGRRLSRCHVGQPQLLQSKWTTVLILSNMTLNPVDFQAKSPAARIRAKRTNSLPPLKGVACV
jgi:hypothetical protein